MTTRGGLQDNNNDTDSSTNSELELIALCYITTNGDLSKRFYSSLESKSGPKHRLKKKQKRTKKPTREKRSRDRLFASSIITKHTRSLTLSIYLKHHGHHVREIVPAPLFEEGNAHFDGAFGRRSGFSVVCLAVSFFLFHFFSTARIRSLFRFCGRKSSEREERFLNRDDFYARVVFLLNVPRLDAKRARGRMRRVYMRAI